MKRFALFSLTLFFCFSANSAVITWDGGGGDGLWATATNWNGDIVPGISDDAVLDNSIIGGNYTVTLPAGAVNTTINTLTISPNSGNTIRLILPSTNTAAPALTINQSSGDVILINNGGILENSNTAAAGTVISISGTGKTRINNGGRYIHNNALNSVVVVSSLSIVAGTELGVVEYAQGSIVAFPSNAIPYGSMELTTTSTKTFTTTGSQDVTIRGFLKINAGVTFNSTKNGAFLIAGDLIIDGIFDLSPLSPSIANSRRLIFNGTSNQTVSGSGNFTFGANFFNIEINSGATVTLQRGINLSNATSTFIVNTGGTLQMADNVINGACAFQLSSGGWLGIGSADGITAIPTSLGNVQTAARSFATDASYEYNGGVAVTQVTGDGLPTTISATLKINTDAGMGTSGVTLSQNTTVSGILDLTKGKVTSSVSGLLNIADNATAINYSTVTNNSFVVGRLKKTGDDSFVFPIGEGAEMHTFALSNVSGQLASDAFQVEYFKANPQTSFGGTTPPGTDHMSALEYWMVNRVVGILPIIKRVTLQATAYTEATNLASLVIINNPTGSAWQNDGNSGFTGGGSAGTVTSNDISSFGPYTFASTVGGENPLPITLLSFDASKLNNTRSSINWELGAVCSSAAKFEIQRAGTDKGFLTIGILAGSTTDRLYNFIDNELKNGINYYRLKMTGEDGKITYSRTVAVMNGINGLLLTSLIPTVITNSATLTIASSAQQKLDLVIVDMQGRLVKKQPVTVAAGNTTIELSMSGLAAGLYQLTGINADGKTNTTRFVKQ